ncbi:uncharacterized protein A4U43_C07F17580 [Asparagus officinalis]|uniref:Uncharacterized protein n=1 Tax=Asparagus officinalis TaxID=4686 RepID=A0A5P1EG41_ASPOF|nr:uncharacterized protein A4U43_C07F17580 [Asparagus officinalis]
MEVRRLAKDNAEARETLAMLEAIPPHARKIDSDDTTLKIESLYALLNLGIRNDINSCRKRRHDVLVTVEASWRYSNPPGLCLFNTKHIRYQNVTRTITDSGSARQVLILHPTRGSNQRPFNHVPDGQDGPAAGRYLAIVVHSRGD